MSGALSILNKEENWNFGPVSIRIFQAEMSIHNGSLEIQTNTLFGKLVIA